MAETPETQQPPGEQPQGAPPEEPKTPAKRRRKKADEEPQLSVEDFISDDARDRIPIAGLLADQPQLREEQHTRAEWQELLADYLTSKRI